MPEYAVSITENCSMFHHNGQEWNKEEHWLAGRFFKADTPVPEGFDFYDVPTEWAAYAIYNSDTFNGDCFVAYTLTRDQILADSVPIPYPQAYWNAEVYTNGLPHQGNYRFGYLFSVELY
jgi:hypothetical protein